MTTATENGTFVLAAYLYDPLSRRTSLVYGNGTSQAFSYSTAGDLLTMAHTLSGTGATYTNSYTKAHQLAYEVVSNAAWQYLPAVFETTSYTPANNLNQYVTVTQGASPSVTLGYDANGNLTGDGVWGFGYDAENRLRTASKSATDASYQYDPLGRRQAKVVNNVTTSFLSDGDEEIAEFDGAGGLLRRYVPGPGTDQPIAMVTPSGGSSVHSYFHANRQGSTVAMSNDAGTVAEGPFTYDAYGNGAPSTGVPFKYTGRRIDPETGLYYYRARYYSASLGRFLQTDPIGYEDQMNLYGYVNNDPINATDPSGMCGGRVHTARAQADCRHSSSASGFGITAKNGSRFPVKGGSRASAIPDLIILLSVQDNRTSGLAVEDRIEEDFRRRGYQTVRHVYMCDPATGLCSYVDVVARNGTHWKFVEVKSGENSRFSPNQVAVWLAILRGDAIPRSSKSEEIGLENGKSLRQQGVRAEYGSVTEP